MIVILPANIFSPPFTTTWPSQPASSLGALRPDVRAPAPFGNQDRMPAKPDEMTLPEDAPYKDVTKADGWRKT
jgi:hypothetical protein